MKNESEYIQVGTTIYKKSYQPTIDGSFIPVLLKWNFDVMCRDISKESAHLIPKYDGFWNEPNLIDYKRECRMGKNRPYYNRFHPPTHTPKEGLIDHTEKYLRRIFKDRYDLFIDYMHVLYVHPKQKLPAICLVSSEKNSGKTTFLSWIQVLFDKNASTINIETLMSKFNSDWSESLICIFDEAKLYTDKEMNRMKELVTARTFLTEVKGIDRTQTPWHGKFFIGSNHEFDLIRIDADEDRFWVEKVEPINVSYRDSDLLSKMISEIPAFIHRIIHHKQQHPNVSRLCFQRELYYTSALEKIIQNSRNSLEAELATIIISIFEQFDFESFQATPIDIESFLSRNRGVKLGQIRNVLKNRWNLEPSNNSNSYKRICRNTDGVFHILEKSEIGRYYEFEKSFFYKRFDDLMI